MRRDRYNASKFHWNVCFTLFISMSNTEGTDKPVTPLELKVTNLSFCSFSLSGLRRQKKDRHIDFALECRSRLFGSEYRWTAFNSTLLAQSDGYHQIILTLRDIHEDKLKELREQQALQEAFDAAKAANMAKNEFLRV